MPAFQFPCANNRDTSIQNRHQNIIASFKERTIETTPGMMSPRRNFSPIETIPGMISPRRNFSPISTPRPRTLDASPRQTSGHQDLLANFEERTWVHSPRKLVKPRKLEVSQNSGGQDLVASFQERMSKYKSMVAPSRPPAQMCACSPVHSAQQIGSEVKVGQHIYRKTGLLGHGSFSSVWSATSLEGFCEVALKETICRSQQELSDAEREANILELISGPATATRTPTVLARETQPTSSGETIARVAMTKIQGNRLSNIMQRFQLDASRKPATYETSMHIEKACKFAMEMLSQLVPTFRYISTLALHRDISMENILVDVGSGCSSHEFGIVDFGFAIASKEWPALMTQLPLVGCCRYWPASGWYLFEHGVPHLLECKRLRVEYETQLDLHALGILAIQVFVTMLPSVGNSMPHEIAALMGAWEVYWQHSTSFWECMIKASKGEWDWDKVRRHFIANKAFLVIESDLESLCTALTNVRLACSGVDDGRSFTKYGSLFTAMLELIGQVARPLDQDMDSDPCGFASWLRIEILLASGSLTEYTQPLPLNRASGRSNQSP